MCRRPIWLPEIRSFGMPRRSANSTRIGNSAGNRSWIPIPVEAQARSCESVLERSFFGRREALEGLSCNEIAFADRRLQPLTVDHADAAARTADEALALN
jgi:hypothetical protein